MKSFDKAAFKEDLKAKLQNTEKTYLNFETTFKSVLDKHAPEKKKTLRANSKPYVTKDMRKAIMKRSEIATRLGKSPTEENSRAFKKQRNFCSRLYI